ncbi:MAG: carbamoyl-phosphate synthase large subunit, carbamoyl-phosphate synthase large subunit [Candidatus Peregrinibacteria bacterium GW2011_GWC2_39_14]|nr:MAG: Carbamoyl-phosphate synthase, large subunit [Candidatus Peregrinibacteria bacterium GW2011_GWA2_38_36]KKR07130.1 MAG: carbamoyl-phosphate synthase large subunit, carbamoyl-phosphate synthase large subunit [Candidatus Peregrinibacteria bacterium GW2011_GWC2_39_14]
MTSKIRKVLILGSGALKIGEAGEFDYSGSQAIKALKEEKIKTVLLNPNIATIQTSEGMADKVYFLPVNAEFAEKVIEKERPDGILLAFGGQTALNCGVELYRKGILKKYKVTVLGTPVSVIEKTEDRDLFKEALNEIGLNSPKSLACESKTVAMNAAKKIGYPVMVRAAYSLGGLGSGIAYETKELETLLDSAFSYSNQVLIEECLKGWKEVEYEVVRDKFDNCITVCNMENFDPLGIHTGESIVIAPSQTLTNHEYHMLRSLSIKAIRALGVIGECNIQYALDPTSHDYRVIEVNARLSRSSALASKATGYPLAYIAAKLALGYRLSDLKNAVTKTTSAFFEPALDYVALKIPRWDLDKFRMVSKEISSAMKSVGEIMALGRSFEEVLQKGLRMLQIGLHGLTANHDMGIIPENLEGDLKRPTPKRILVIAEALKRGWTTKKIANITKIDLWFLDKLKNIIEFEKLMMDGAKLTPELMLQAKKLGFSDKQLANILKKTTFEIRDERKKMGITPMIKQIDTMAAEWPAKTNYLYATYHGESSDTARSDKKKIIVLGSGAYCIGSSVEFDWCCVNALKAAKKYGYETIMINYNPETVSTDYDICDKLYFDELSFERVMDIYEAEKASGVIISTGGQIPNNLALKLHKAGVKILGTSPEKIDVAEDRNKFSAVLDKIKVDQPRWKKLAGVSETVKFAAEVGYPVLVRPSYVLSGAAMSVAHNEISLKAFLNKAAKISSDAPVVVSKFEVGAKEIEIDAVAMNGKLLIYAINEHIENAGVHSGDATIVLPPQKLYIETIRRVKEIAKQIAKELEITGPFNIQFLAKNNEIKVIECNLRASRSFPFASKVTGYNFIEIAVSCMLGDKKYMNTRFQTLDLDYVAVKVPQFSFTRLKGADPVLGVEMASTGEVACFGDDSKEAFLKGFIATGFKIPKKNILVSIGKEEDKFEFVETAEKLIKLGYKLYATEGTSKYLSERGIENKMLEKIGVSSKSGAPNLLDYLAERKLDLVINIPKNYNRDEETAGYLIRRKAIDLNIPLITNLQIGKMFAMAIESYNKNGLKIKSWDEYLENLNRN